VRLDGSAGDASRRGEILETFKGDSRTSICLLTKASAGVGLNLTVANFVVVLEPSMDAHDELQSIARVHRIGQTRKVSVLKFYMTTSFEERILLRRQQRGELSVSINSTTGGATTTEEDGAEGEGVPQLQRKMALKGTKKQRCRPRGCLLLKILSFFWGSLPPEKTGS
jgi:SNF2 family DNA or RNA helicase